MASPRSDGIPIPSSGSLEREKRFNALAGPSSEGAIQRRPSRGVTPSPPRSPSSAPPTPSVISVTHPSPFIHTHHPRRGSMTPLGLNLISPVSPFSPVPARQTGFNIADPGVTTPNMLRRGSAASTTSTLTQSRPTPPGSQLVYPPNWNPGRRRSSLTPSLPTLAAASPTKAHVNGRVSRPTSSEDSAPSLRSRTRTADAPTARGDVSPSRLIVDMYGRRGSMPHLGHGRPHAKYHPVLPPPRGSVGDVDDGFKFGSGSNAVAGPSAATHALRAVDRSPHSAAASIRRRASRDAFEEAEDEEADRQRRAFLAATYGEDGRRARERLSIGGASGHSASPGTPGATLRRQSLMLWERMGMAALDEPPASAPSGLLHAVAHEDLGPRRGSLPIAIPGGGLGRSSSRRSNRDIDAPVVTRSDATPPDETEEETSGESDGDEKRPLPPLLPLSDPGPRLLPSTLALHRANHLLASRNLQSEPLPHPLPPSLHPPAPVDVAEFDIDFILSGSSSQLGISKPRAPGARVVDSPMAPPTPTLRIGADEEDSFAKFVGEFDDEYGGRRGEWTFRMSAPNGSQTSYDPFPLSPLDRGETSSRPVPKTEWESSGAGKYEIFPTGEVRSISTGRLWRVRKSSAREFELEQAGRKSSFHGLYYLTAKSVHRDNGGIKLSRDVFWPTTSSSDFDTKASMSTRTERTSRFDSEDSAMTMTPRSVPASGKKADHAKNSKSKISRSTSKEPESDTKKDRSLGGVLKRGLQSFKAGSLGGSHSADEKRMAREERERERQQAHTWAGASNIHQPSWATGIKNQPVRAPPPERSASASQQTNSSHSGASGSSDDSRGVSWYTVEDRKPRKASSDDEVAAKGGSLWKEGPAWKGVPGDAVAMVIPLDDKVSRTATSSSQIPLQQALLVWYVPFNSEGGDDMEHRSSSASSRASLDQTSQAMHGSLPKFQKLLRRRASKDKDVIKKEAASLQPHPSPSKPRQPPLPFRSFRVVARVVVTRELCSEVLPLSRNGSGVDVVGGGGSGGGRSSSVTASGNSSSSPFDNWQKDQNPFNSDNLPISTSPGSGLSLSPVDETLPSAEKSEKNGRNFPTVIAVCHSRSQGVEFVLEGLDRLGLCIGESAWGPTGYEEWRGTGLSEQGRMLLDLLWAGCTGVMGLSA